MLRAAHPRYRELFSDLVDGREVRYERAMLNHRAAALLLATAWASCLGLAGCDPQVKSASGGPPQAAVAPPTPSRELETCGATGDCENGLRCVAAVCRKPTTSRLGEYFWAAGDAAAAKADYGRAAEQYQQAMGQFEAEKIGAPPGLLCAYGAALRKKEKDPKAGEQAARLLHRCVLATAPGAPDYRPAMNELVELEAQGLEPSKLASEQPADTYLTKQPKKVAVEKPVLEIAQSTPATDKGYQAFVDALRPYEPAFVTCWQTYSAAAQQTTMAVLLNLKYRVTLGDDDYVVGAKLEVTPVPGSGGPEAAAAQCVKDAVTATVTEFGKNTRLSSGNWNGAVTVTLRAP